MKYFVEHLPARSEKAVTDWGPGLEPAAQRSPNKRSKLSLYKSLLSLKLQKTLTCAAVNFYTIAAY